MALSLFHLQLKLREFIIAFILACVHLASNAQTTTLSGTVSSEGEPLFLASVIIKGTSLNTTSSINGKYSIDSIPEGTYIIQTKAFGHIPLIDTLKIKKGQVVIRDYKLIKDYLDISKVVITGSRKNVEQYKSPVIVNTVNAKTLSATQSMNIADGLSYSPGLRVENNCQNCGFTQLRMNGLDGPYSQILINSRPVFSALAGVYGLEMLPTNMVDRIEVVRGGGSVMYGGNAIAGTVNIITKDPFENSFEVGFNQSLINGEVPDRTINFNGSLVSEDLDKGITFFGFNRSREHWDANGDGLSEIVQLQNSTFGFDAFYNFNDRSKLKLGTYYINEFRRGGNKFDLFPHQTDITEQLKHNIYSANLSLEHYSKDNKNKLTLYGSMQHIDRESYYGGGGRIIEAGDSLTASDILAINAYGTSTDFSTVSGLQYNRFINSTFTLSLGSEFIYNDVLDEMPGYERSIDQQVGTWGTFAELEINPVKKLTFLVGGRFDQLNIQGNYNLEGENLTNDQGLQVFVPRLSGMYSIKKNLKLRASLAQGYRGPQAFDEDLHIETVGGAARFIQINPDLEVERSNSAVLSLNYDKFISKNQMSLVLEGFYTQLINPFIFANQTQLPNGVAVISKRNGEGAVVSGINLEANLAFGRKLIFQSGATIQNAVYDIEEEIWAPSDPSDNSPATVTSRILRTPNTYGFFSMVYKPLKELSLSYSGVITGSMLVPHVIDVETERTVIKNTPSFFENNFKASFTMRTKDLYKLELFGGVQNIFNSYQSDFDIGPERDAGYIYGPLRPRTFFMGLKFGFN